MNVLSVASEVFPLIKTGGLADVAGALPLALKSHGIRMRTLLPGYPSVLEKLQDAETVGSFANLFGTPATIVACDIDGLETLVLVSPALFERDGGPYLDAAGQDYKDNFRRFAALSLAAAEIAAGTIADWMPDIVHCHDWQAALTPVYMRYGPAAATPTVLTIHNIAFQGQFGPGLAVFPELALPWDAYTVDGVEYYGDVCFLKGGLKTATAITTVSPSYALEILTPEFGIGLQGILNDRVGDLTGIVNGIDDRIWDPATDPHISQNYTATSLKRRSVNRTSVETAFGLDDSPGPIFCVVSRLTLQKGMDLLVDAVDEIVEQGGKLAILGSGDIDLQQAFTAAAERHRGRVGIVLGYNEALSHQMQAGCDAIIIPSRFEPCGLTQLYGLRYGCVPVVGRTGGLADTVIDANEAAIGAGVATGIQFSPITAAGLRLALRRAFAAFNDAKLWTRLQTQGMKSEVSWDRSAARYAALYSGLLAKAKDRS